MNDSVKPNTCDRADDLIAFLYGELDGRETRSFELHRRECETCKSEATELGSIHQAITAWRDHSLGLDRFASTTAQTTALVERKPSALAAIQSFLALSPLWMKAASGVAVVLLAVLTGVAVMERFRSPRSMTSVASQNSQQKDFAEAVDKEVASRLALQAAQEKPPSSVVVTKNDDKHAQIQSSGPKTLTAASNAPQKQRKPLTRSERNQLAADLRLTVNKDEDSLLLLSDRINREN